MKRHTKHGVSWARVMQGLLVSLVLWQEAALASPAIPYVYTDLDGTALLSTKAPNPETATAMRLLQDCGGLVGVATGRSLEQARPALDAIDPHLPVILYNGCAVYWSDRDSLSVLASIPDSALSKIASVVKQLPGIPVLWQSVDAAEVEEVTDVVREFSARNGLTIRLATRGNVAQGHRPILKVLMLTTKKNRDQTRDKCRQALGGTVRVVASTPTVVEILPVGVDKAWAINKALAPLGITLGQCLAFGDAENDVEMLRQARFGIAMGDGDELAKDAADAIIGSHNGPAIAQFITSFLVGDSCKVHVLSTDR